MAEDVADAPPARSGIDDADDTGWRVLPPAARVVRTIAGAFGGLIASVVVSAVTIGILVEWSLTSDPPRSPIAASFAVALVITAAGAAIGAWMGRIRWRRTRWRIDGIGLHVRRGVVWQTEVLIPRSRVQHLDIERGPLERRFDLATLIVHTAGTQTHALRQSGLRESDAVALRDVLVPDATRHGDAL